MDEDGDLRIVGRMNSADRIKMSGDVVYLSPIEKQMKHMEGVKDCAVSRNQSFHSHQLSIESHHHLSDHS